MPLSDAEKVDVRRHCGYPTRAVQGLGGTSVQVYQLSVNLEIRMNTLTDPEVSIVRRYLGTLTNLETAVPRSSENLDTDQAAVWSRNRSEPEDRLRLFDEWRRRLCAFMAVPPGPFFPSRDIRLVV